MKTFLKKLVMTLVLLTIILITLLPGCSQPQMPVAGFNPKLSISEPPALGKPVKLTLTFDSPIPKGLEDTELFYLARIVLPPGFYEVTEGNIDQKEQIIPGKVNTLEVTIKSIKVGNGTISSSVELFLASGGSWGGGGREYDDLFIAIYSDHADVSENQDLPNTPTEITTTYTTSTTFTTETTNTNTAPATSDTTIAPSLSTKLDGLFR
jgi:hypothetical protein